MADIIVLEVMAVVAEVLQRVSAAAVVAIRQDYCRSLTLLCCIRLGLGIAVVQQQRQLTTAAAVPAEVVLESIGWQ